MISLTKHIKTNYLFNMRCLHKSQSLHNELKAMNKVMKGLSSKKKYRYVEDYSLPSPKVFSAGSLENKRSPNSKRANVLNKLFMHHITDLMATGENCSVYLGHGIEISQVQVWPDFKGLNVYWIAKGTEVDDTIEDILIKHSKALRHELTQLRVVGVVPKITFVKDKQYARAAEVDRILSKVNLTEDVSIEAPLLSKLEIEEQADKLNEQKLEDEEVIKEDDLPPMPNNVLGLNHTEIMQKVIKELKKSEANHRKKKDSTPNAEYNALAIQEIEFVNMKEQKEAFKRFLQKRQLLKAKAKRNKKCDRLELDNMRDLEEEEQNQQYFEMWNFREENDFIEEDDDDESRK